jgi:alpha-L-rhamnosidase
MAGIEIDERQPGYKHSFIQPQPGGGITRVKASHDTMYGRVSSMWEIREGQFDLAVEVPANTTAVVHLPHALLTNMTESGRALTDASGITSRPQDGDSVVVDIVSGHYQFHCQLGT